MICSRRRREAGGGAGAGACRRCVRVPARRGPVMAAGLAGLSTPRALLVYIAIYDTIRVYIPGEENFCDSEDDGVDDGGALRGG